MASKVLTIGRLKQLIGGFDEETPVTIWSCDGHAGGLPINPQEWSLLSVYPNEDATEVAIDIGPNT